jgi:predicted HTH transcriptional regulator
MEVPKTLESIESLIQNRVQESLHLDYKMSMAIDDSKRDEIAKDVSAFSNSDGGLIIYGVKEEQHLPVKIDNGVNHKNTRENGLSKY